MPKIFISYRREDSKHAVGRLHAALKRHVRNPKRDIFIDIDNIPRGVDFIDHLDGQVAQCDVMLAVIGPAWISIRDTKTGQRRLDDPNDFVRIEVASALKRGIPVVPVVLDGTRLPTADELPEDLKSLARRNGERLEHESFDADVTRLIKNLPGNAPKAAPQPPATPRSGSATWIGTAVALVLIVLGGSAYAWFGNPGDWRGTGGWPSTVAPPVDSVAANSGGGATQRADDPAMTTPSSAPAPAAAAPAATTPAPDPLAEARARTLAAARDLSLRDDAAWSLATRTDTRASYEAYLGDYRTGAHSVEANARLSSFAATAAEISAWSIAQSAGTKDSYAAYLRAYPDRPNANTARTKIEEFDRVSQADVEARAWSTAERMDSVSAYEIYLKNHPQGPNVVQATSRIAALKDPQRLVGRWDHHQFKVGETFWGKLGTLPCLPGVEVKTASQAALQIRGRVYSGAEMFFPSYSTLRWQTRQANGMVFTNDSGLTATWKLDDGSLVLSNGTQSCSYKK